MAASKLFISYSWTSSDHQAWVLQLASDLRASGVDVILDKWDLKEGHDAHAFMESMVIDPDIKKVVLVCDKKYAEKTDGRKGGVGTEAQIISSDIYAKQKQEKFVAIVVESNPDGTPTLPAYYRSRVFIDFRNEASFSENFDKLLRWAHDQPLLRKPEIGSIPSYLSEPSSALTLNTSPTQRRAIDALRNMRPNAIGAVVDYLNLVSTEFEKLRIESTTGPVDDAVIQSLEDFIPYRNELIEAFLCISLYGDSPEMRIVLHRFFEKLAGYFRQPSNKPRHKEGGLDNYHFIVHELYLYLLASLIQQERFESASYLMEAGYFMAGNPEYGRDEIVRFPIFRKYLQSMELRKKRLQLNRISLRADLLKGRCIGTPLIFSQLMQADFVLFLRSSLDPDGDLSPWWPETLLYAAFQQHGPFEIFARSTSSAYFGKVKMLLGIENKEALNNLMSEFQRNRQNLPRWDYQSLNVGQLIGIDQISTKK